MIYSGERIRVDPFNELKFSDALRAKLELDLKAIHELYGPMVWDEPAAEAFRAWFATDMPPVPEHPRLEHYLPRRIMHFFKLCMVHSAARGDDLVIRMEDYQLAQDMLLEAESYMPDVFRAMKAIGSDSNVMDECFAWMYADWSKHQKPIQEHRIIYFLSQRIPGHSCQKVLEVMVHARMIELAAMGGPGANAYRPVPKVQHNS